MNPKAAENIFMRLVDVSRRINASVNENTAWIRSLNTAVSQRIAVCHPFRQNKKSPGINTNTQDYTQGSQQGLCQQLFTFLLLAMPGISYKMTSCKSCTWCQISCCYLMSHTGHYLGHKYPVSYSDASWFLKNKRSLDFPWLISFLPCSTAQTRLNTENSVSSSPGLPAETLWFSRQAAGKWLIIIIVVYIQCATAGWDF